MTKDVCLSDNGAVLHSVFYTTFVSVARTIGELFYFIFFFAQSMQGCCLFNCRDFWSANKGRCNKRLL